MLGIRIIEGERNWLATAFELAHSAGPAGVVGLVSPLLFLLFLFSSLGRPTTLPFLLGAPSVKGIVTPFGVAAAEGATLVG